MRQISPRAVSQFYDYQSLKRHAKKVEFASKLELIKVGGFGSFIGRKHAI
jgi:hypothetical protein